MDPNLKDNLLTMACSHEVPGPLVSPGQLPCSGCPGDVGIGRKAGRWGPAAPYWHLLCSVPSTHLSRSWWLSERGTQEVGLQKPREHSWGVGAAEGVVGNQLAKLSPRLDPESPQRHP